MKTLQTLFLLGVIASSAACGYSSKATTPSAAGVMPAISALAPNSATSGSAGFMLTVNGSNFSAKSVVNWNGGAQTTTFVSANQLMAAIAAADLTAPATVTDHRDQSRRRRNWSLRQRRHNCRNLEQHGLHDQ